MKKNMKRQLPVYYILPILIIAAIIPLIVHLKVVPIDKQSFEYWIGDKENFDFFSYYKAIFTILLSVSSLIVFFIARYKKLIDTKQLLIYYIPMIVYVLMILLSSLLSKYPNTAWMGFVDRYEGAYVLLSYLAILFTTINLVHSEKLLKIAIISLFIGAFGVGMIGIFQFFGLDLFKSEAGRLFMLPSQYRSSNLSFTFGTYTIYSTLYNTNYVGSYMAMLLPLAFAAFLFVKNNYAKLILGAFTCLMFANWLGCRSRGGYIGGAIAIVILSIIMRKHIVKNFKSMILLAVSIIVIFIGMNAAANGELGGRIVTMISDISKKSAVTGEGTGSKAELLEDIVFSDKKVSILYGKNKLNMSLDGNQLGFSDTEGKPLAIKKDASGTITFEDSRYLKYAIGFDAQNNVFNMKLKDMQFNLYLDPSGFKIVGERGVLLNQVDHPKVFGFEGREKFASMRGYIWSRSIPLLLNNVLVGGGPDTFVMQFPQHDYVGKLRAFDKVNQIVDKPHNIFLQIGINTGIVSLIAVIFLFGAYLLASLRQYLKRELLGDGAVIGAALFAAVLGYVLSSFANDSLVSVAPVFWVILGLGISCNLLVTNLKGEEAGIVKQDTKERPKRGKMVANKQ